MKVLAQLIVKVDHQRRTAGGTKHVALLARFKVIAFHLVFAGMEDDILAEWVKIQVAVLNANGAIAVGDLGFLDGRDLELILYCSTVAASLVPDLLGGLRRCHYISLITLGWPGCWGQKV